jgi:hypothetical protein
MIAKYILLLLGAALLTVSASPDEETVSAGIITAVGVNFFREYRLIFLHKFLNDVQQNVIPDQTWNIPIKEL